MFDELGVLRENMDLQRLLSHYADAGAADREVWQDRLMVLEGVKAAELVKLHGLLIAFAWVDQNTGNTPVMGPPGTVPGCYRVTAGGLRARKAAHAAPEENETDALETAVADPAETPEPKRRESRKGKTARLKKAGENQTEVREVAADEQVPSLA